MSYTLSLNNRGELYYIILFFWEPARGTYMSSGSVLRSTVDTQSGWPAKREEIGWWWERQRCWGPRVARRRRSWTGCYAPRQELRPKRPNPNLPSRTADCWLRSTAGYGPDPADIPTGDETLETHRRNCWITVALEKISSLNTRRFLIQDMVSVCSAAKQHAQLSSGLQWHIAAFHHPPRPPVFHRTVCSNTAVL